MFLTTTIVMLSDDSYNASDNNASKASTVSTVSTKKFEVSETLGKR